MTTSMTTMATQAARATVKRPEAAATFAAVAPESPSASSEVMVSGPTGPRTARRR